MLKVLGLIATAILIMAGLAIHFLTTDSSMPRRTRNTVLGLGVVAAVCTAVAYFVDAAREHRDDQETGKYREAVISGQGGLTRKVDDVQTGQDRLHTKLDDALALLQRAAEQNASLQNRYDYGYVLFTPREGGLEHWDNLRELNGTKLQFDAKWLQSAYSHDDGNAILRLAGLSLSLYRNGQRNFAVEGFSPPTQIIPLQKGAKKELPMVIGGRANCTIEVIEPNKENPVFAFGFSSVADGDPTVGLLIK